MKCLRIQSYFSIETDLPAKTRAWPEFVNGKGYDVDLRDISGTEEVKVRHLAGGKADVQIAEAGEGTLFDRGTGRVIHAMSAHADALVIECT